MLFSMTEDSKVEILIDKWFALEVNIHIGVNTNKSRLFDGIESAGARNRPTDSQAVLVLCLPWYLSYFSLIWSLLVETAEDSSGVWTLGIRIFSSSSFRSGYKRKSNNLKNELTDYSFSKKGIRSFKHWILVHRKLTRICFNVVQNDASTIF